MLNGKNSAQSTAGLIVRVSTSILFAGENLVPEPSNEVAQLQGAGAAGGGRKSRTNLTQPEQPAPRPKRCAHGQRPGRARG